MKTVIELKNISAGYNNALVLKDINLAIKEGEQLFVLGGNGSGKTTLVKTILGLVKQDKGEVLIYGERRTQEAVASNFGYVPQSTSGIRTFPISVSEVIKIECSMADNCPVGVIEHLEKFNAEHLMDRKLSDLSGGEFQRVLLARAFVTQPQVLVLDEPTNNLDVESIHRLHEIIVDYKNSGHTIITISHDDDVVEETRVDSKSRVVKLEEGTLVNLD